MRFYLDTEFIEDGRTIDLVSIAVVAENGQEFYRQNSQNSQADFRNANIFVSENVLPKLWPCPKGIPGPKHVYGLCADSTCVWRPKRMIRDELFTFVNSLTQAHAEPVDDPLDWDTLQVAEPDAVIRTRTIPASKPEFWGCYAGYDWVVLCQLFGRMDDLPKGWPMYCRDLKQYADYVGRFDLPPEGKDEHNALSDARWVRAAYDYVAEVDREYARRKVSRPEHKEREAVRGAEEKGYAQVPSGGDLQRELQQIVVPEENSKAVDQEVLSDAGIC